MATYIYMCIHRYIHTYTCTYIYIHIYTYIYGCICVNLRYVYNMYILCMYEYEKNPPLPPSSLSPSSLP